MAELLLLNQMIADRLLKFKQNGVTNKTTYNYSYPVQFDFEEGTEGNVLVERVTISGSQIFGFQQIVFKSDDLFSILLKDSSTGRELSNGFISSDVLSTYDFANQQNKGIYMLPMPKLMDGSGELTISITNLTSNANTVKLNFIGISINDK